MVANNAWIGLNRNGHERLPQHGTEKYALSQRDVVRIYKEGIERPLTANLPELIVDSLTVTGRDRLGAYGLFIAHQVAYKNWRTHPRIGVLEFAAEGASFLDRAIDKYEPNRRDRKGFKSFVWYQVNQGMRRLWLDSPGGKNSIVHIPEHLVETAKRIRDNPELLRSEEDPKEVERMERALRVVPEGEVRPDFSLDVQIREDDPETYGDVLEDSYDHSGEADRRDAQRFGAYAVRLMLTDLDEIEQNVLALRFGLDGGGGLTLEKVGERIGGLSRERARQIQVRALRKLNQRMTRRNQESLEAVLSA